jgi:multicomponent Na+:H+ antiporter subunit C
MSVFPYIVAGVLFVGGLYGVVTSRNYVHAAVCLTVMQASTYVVLIAVGYVRHGTAPITKGGTQGKPLVDPVVQALTLTDVVVSVIVLALVLALALQADRHVGSMDPDALSELRG